ncbi:hypothetical protein RB199_02210 [Streptomyces libani]
MATVDSLTVRPVRTEQLAGGRSDSMLQLRWTALPVPDMPVVPDTTTVAAEGWAVLDENEIGLKALLDAAALDWPAFNCPALDWPSLAEQDDVPGVVLWSVPETTREGLADGAHDLARRVLERLQSWLAEERYQDSRLVILTRGAVLLDGETVSPAAAAVWGARPVGAVGAPGTDRADRRRCPCRRRQRCRGRRWRRGRPCAACRCRLR